MVKNFGVGVLAIILLAILLVPLAAIVIGSIGAGVLNE